MRAFQTLEKRQLMAADFELPLGATATDNAEFLLGRVAVTPVFFESDGQIDDNTQDWSAEEIDSVLATITEGVNWWVDALDQLDTVHELEFVIDDTFAREPFATPYEPIDRSSFEFNSYVGSFLRDQGLQGAGSLEAAVAQFNHSQRLALETDWAFTIFIADSSDDPDGMFAAGGFGAAFAYPGGLFIVSPSTRPATTFAHEMGHIFWARDEYPGGGSYVDQRGYYNTQNLNAFDNPAPGFVAEDSIMRGGLAANNAFYSHTSPESTLAMVGWQDSDGDGIFDVADVPLTLDLVGGIELGDDGSRRLRATGSASAQTLRNLNSSGNQSDITLNNVDEIQIRIGDGSWETVQEIGRHRGDVSIDIALPAESTGATVQLRAIDRRAGVTSPVVQISESGNLETPFAINGRVVGPDASEGTPPLDLSSVSIQLVDAAGTPVEGESLAADSFADQVDEFLPDAEGSIVLSVAGAVNASAAGVTTGSRPDSVVFASFNRQLNRWVSTFDDRTTLTATFAQPVGAVDVGVIGTSDSVARLEAFNAAGQSLGRVTSDGLADGERQNLRFVDDGGRIASLRISGHAKTEIEIDSIATGMPAVLDRSDDGRFRLADAMAGEYFVQLFAENTIYDFGGPIDVVVDDAGDSTFVEAVASRVDSQWHNTLQGEDVDGDGKLLPIDALFVINQLRVSGSTVLDRNANPTGWVDVTNDGMLSPLDALRVINALREQSFSEGESQLGQPVNGNLAAIETHFPSAARPGGGDALDGNTFDGNSWGRPDWVVDAALVDFSGPPSGGQSQAGLPTDTSGETRSEFALDATVKRKRWGTFDAEPLAPGTGLSDRVGWTDRAVQIES